MIPYFSARADYHVDSDVPEILPRLTWDNTPDLNALMTWQPQNKDYPSDWQPVDRIVIHHSATPTADTVSAIARIQSIYRFHSVTQGWGDIGYSYIIDQQGKIYEGRYGGNGSRAAHVYNDKSADNYNFGSIGIVLLGDYSSADANPQMYESLERLVGWLAAQNGLDPAANRTSMVWNRSRGSFSSVYTGPVVIGHQDVDATSCPGLINLAKVRQAAAVFAAKFKDYIYQPIGGSKIYKIQNGKPLVFDSLAAFTASGGTYSRLALISPTQLNLFSDGRFYKYPDGSLLQAVGDPTVYLIDGGKKRTFSVDAKQFVKLGFDFVAVKPVSADELLAFPDGPPIKYAVDKTLISDGVKVYLAENGKLRWITSGNLFNFLKYKWANVKNLGVETQSFLEGSPLAYPDGTLLREQGKEAVYLIKDGTKRQFFSAESFVRNGYKWDKVILVDATEISLYAIGGFVPYPAGTLVRAAGGPSVYSVAGTQLKPYISAEIFLNLKNKWTDVLVIPDNEASHYTIGEPVKYPEGTLLRAKSENNVYLISSGVPVVIDAATFKVRKYKWTSVLVISDQDFALLYKPNSAPIITPSPTPTFSPAPTPTPAPTTTPSPSSVPVTIEPKIRIGLFEITSGSAVLTANGPYDIYNKAGQIISSGTAGQNYTYSYSSPAEAFVKIIPRDSNGVVEIVSYEEHPSWKPELNYNKFRGTVEIVYSAASSKVWAVNELSMEHYLKGIAEILQGDPIEHVKTMIVAARTYGYYYVQKGGKRAGEPYHLLNTSSDQLYKGYVRETLAPDIVSAVAATAGEIAVYNGQPIITAYSSGAPELAVSGTKSGCSVWGGNFCLPELGYLAGGVKDMVGAPYTQTVCGGGNHCVGLSAAGSRQFAKTGTKNYQEILKHYYPGIEIRKIY